ncbi:MAG: acetyl-CoA C-acyltransferase [Chitinophagaceae bacterium]|nr:MAG: acetyl-CoA C-acyltransferase [Chitinophagaceae bacterium]
MPKVVFIDGVRTPFLKSGTDYQDLMSYQLGAHAIKALLYKSGIDSKTIDSVILGTTISNVKTGNVAREAAIQAGISYKSPCHTVTMACISANKAITDGAEMVAAGRANVFIGGGTDSISDTPILFKKVMRKKLFAARKIKTFPDMLKFALKLRPSDFFPERPSITEYLTGKSMGEDCDLLAAKFEISRKSQDEFALRSHHLAEKAYANGLLNEEVSNIELPPTFKKIGKDNGIRGNSSYEEMERLRPAFVKKSGTVTAANASFLTDGAAVSLYMNAEYAKAQGYQAKAEIVDYVFTAQDPFEELLLGPAYAIAKLLNKLNLTLSDIDVFELHEAFAGQVLANIKALSSETFNRQNLNRESAIGEIPMEKLNTCGGSLSIGHPFGATGSRLITTAVNRLHREDGELALVAACAAGGLGHAMLLKRI